MCLDRKTREGMNTSSSISSQLSDGYDGLGLTNVLTMQSFTKNRNEEPHFGPCSHQQYVLIRAKGNGHTTTQEAESFDFSGHEGDVEPSDIRNSKHIAQTARFSYQMHPNTQA